MKAPFGKKNHLFDETVAQPAERNTSGMDGFNRNAVANSGLYNMNGEPERIKLRFFPMMGSVKKKEKEKSNFPKTEQ